MKSVKALTFDTEKDGWEKSRGFAMREVPMPTLDPKNPEDALSVILKVRYAGFCGSDRGLWYRTAFKDVVHDSLKREGKTTRVVGHEFFAEIVEAGSMVETFYGHGVGTLVSGDSHVTCGRCLQCRIGESHVCTNEKILGISTDGIFAEYVKIPAKNLWRVDEKAIRPEIAAILDPFGNAVHATTVTDFRGQTVAIFGCGPIGLFSILLARNFGASKVIAVDINPENLAMTEKLGADETILIGEPRRPAVVGVPTSGQAGASGKANAWEADAEVVERIMEITHGMGVDVSMEMAGPFSSVNNAIDSTRRGGHVILFGIKDGDLTIPKFSRVIVRGLTIHNVIGREIFRTWHIAERVFSDKKNGIQEKIWNIVLKKGKGTIVPFADFNKDAFEKTLNENPKVIFKVNG